MIAVKLEYLILFLSIILLPCTAGLMKQLLMHCTLIVAHQFNDGNLSKSSGLHVKKSFQRSNIELLLSFIISFDVIDTNKDRSISEEEFLIAFKAYGHENVALDTKFFNSYNMFL